MTSLGDWIRSTIDQRINSSQSQVGGFVSEVVIQDSHRMGVVTKVSGVNVTVQMDDGNIVTAYAGPYQPVVGARVTVSGNRVFG